jgi:RimJ/RimL family protein N-acetyltransferase
MVFTVQRTDERDAREIAAWRYTEPYAMYNMALEDAELVADPASRYFSVRDERGDLIAFIALGPEAQVPGGDYSHEALDIGAGIRPDLTGQGLGAKIIRLAVETGVRLDGADRFRATIAAFNQRAQRAAGKVGFRPVSSFRRPSDRLEFVILERPPVDTEI